MTSYRTTRRRCNYDAPSIAIAKRRAYFNTWTHRMGLVLCAMFVFLAFGAVVFGW